MRLRLIITTLTAALALTSCATDSSNDPATTITETAPGLTPDDLTDHTAQTFELTWALTTDTDRDTYCAAVDELGPDAAADQMAAGAGYDDSLNWPYMAELLAIECNHR